MSWFKDRLHFSHLLLFSSFVLLWLGVGATFSINNSYQYLGLFLGVLAFFRPHYALYALLVSLPLFGDRPSGVQVHYLVLYSSYILFGMYANLLLSGYSFKRFLARVRINNLVLLFIYLFLFVSFLSLIGLPLLGMIKKTVTEDHLYIVKNLLTVGETTLFSSVGSVLLLFQSFLFGLYVYGVSHKNKLDFYKKLILAILVGFLLSIIAGHLDFFGIYDLSWYRLSDGAGHGRFHSFFVNSSWYSQYLAILLPLLPIVLLFIKNTKIAIGFLVFLIVLGEVTLILSMQRGAWITYPPTLLLIWVSIYYVIAKMRDNNISLNKFLKQNWIKVLITIPLTITLSVYIVYGIKDYRKNNNISTADTFVAVSARANRIAKSNDRLDHWPPAIKFFQLNPIFGGGGDSFGWQYKIYYNEDGAKFKGDATDTLSLGQFGTAHNLYLQTLTGKGIFGLLFLMAFIFILIFMLIKKEFLSQKARSLEESVLSLVILGSLLATIVYANVQEIFYVQSVSIIFWVIFFMGISIAFEQTNKKVTHSLNKAFLYTVYLMLILLPFHILNISYVKDFLQEKVPFFSGGFLDTIVWVAFAVIAYTFVMQKKVIKHSHVSEFLIDCDQSDKPQMFHENPTPRAGGIGIFVGNLFLISNPIGWKLIVVALPAFIAGLIDDFNSLTPKPIDSM
ncbi:MAG: O-antigen ligase family protein [Campylobacterota bacterium]|nr:O-antigen ligase family protein [Campylobacterota bacterium]